MESKTTYCLRIRLFNNLEEMVELNFPMERNSTIAQVESMIHELKIKDCPDTLVFRLPMNNVLYESNKLCYVFEEFEKAGFSSRTLDAHDPTVNYYAAMDTHFHRPVYKELEEGSTKDKSERDINPVQVQLEELKKEIRAMRQDMPTIKSKTDIESLEDQLEALKEGIEFMKEEMRQTRILLEEIRARSAAPPRINSHNEDHYM
jgi:peptidoglycan hydrolase CwlO-like protein